MTSRSPQSGNVLFYILLCIALFAALGYAFSRGGTGGAQTISDEKAKLVAAELIAYGNLVADTVSKLRLRGCTESVFEFSTSDYQLSDGTNANTINSNAPSDGKCSLFDIRGGNITPKIFKEGFNGVSSGANSKPGHARFRAFQVANIGTTGASGTASANDLIISFSFLDKNICLAINKILGIDNPGGDPPVPTSTSLSGVSLYTNGSYVGPGIIGSAELDGKKSFCRSTTTAKTSFSFDQVLLAR